MVLYVPGTEETDPKKQNMSLQQIGAAATTLQTSVATNTTDIATINAAWTAFTPTITPGAGTFTSVSCPMRYKQTGKTILYSGFLTITTLGTAAGRITLTVPVPVSSSISIGSGYNLDQQVAVLVSINIFTTGIDLSSFVAGSPYSATGQRIAFSGFYEAA